MKGKSLQPRILYPTRFSFRFNGEIKSFSDKQKLREFSTTKPALQQILREINSLGRKHKRREQKRKRKKKGPKKTPLKFKKMAIGIYISIHM